MAVDFVLASLNTFSFLAECMQSFYSGLMYVGIVGLRAVAGRRSALVFCMADGPISIGSQHIFGTSYFAVNVSMAGRTIYAQLPT